MGGEVFTPTFNYHVPCKGGGGRGSYKKKEVQHAKKTRIPKSSGKDKTLKE